MFGKLAPISREAIMRRIDEIDHKFKQNRLMVTFHVGE
jgi:ABC-type proline/glycine betaine transport system ATPase subunit